MSAELNVKLVLDTSGIAKQAKAGADEAKRQIESTMRSVSVGGGIAQVKQLPGFQEAKSNIAERTKQIKLEQALEKMRQKTEADRAKNSNQLKSIFLAKPPGGAELAKIQALGDINMLDKPPVLKKAPETEGSKYNLLKFAELYANFKILQTVIQGISLAGKELIATFENASKIYAKAVLNGYGVSGSTKLGILSNIIGVSERHVFKFGNAIQYLNPQIENASKIIAETTVPLTQVSWEWNVLMVNIKAMFTLLVSEGASALANFISGLSVLIQLMEKSWIAKLGKGLIGGVITAPFGPLGSILAKLGFSAISQIGKVAAGGKEMPAPSSYMKQLPASAWEKMGLVIGGGGGTNYAAKTATNTEEMKKSLNKLVMAMINPKQSGTNPFGQAIASTP